MFQTTIILGLILMGLLIPVMRRGAIIPAELTPGRLTLWQRGLHRLMLLGVVVAALTGLSAGLFWGGPMHGWLLLLHVGAAPLFAIGLAAVALFWADSRQYRPVREPGDVDSGEKVLFLGVVGGGGGAGPFGVVAGERG